MTIQLYAVTIAANSAKINFDLTITIVTLVASAVSLSYTIMAFATSDHLSGKNRRVVLPAHMMLIAAYGTLVVSRVFALALFAHAYGAFVFVIVGVHLIAVGTGILHQQTTFCADVTQTPQKPRWYLEIPFDVLASFVYVFVYFNLKAGQTRYQNVVFHLLTFVENVIMISLFYVNQPQLWYSPAVLAGVIGLYLLGLLLMVMYYVIFHPTKTKDWYWIGIPKGWLCWNGNLTLEGRNRSKQSREVPITGPTLVTVNGDVSGFHTRTGLRFQNRTSASPPATDVNPSESGTEMRQQNPPSSGMEPNQSNHGSGTEEITRQVAPHTHSTAVAHHLPFDPSPSPSPLPTPVIEDTRRPVAVSSKLEVTDTAPRELSANIQVDSIDVLLESSRSHTSDLVPEVGSHGTDTLQSGMTARSDLARSLSDAPTRSFTGSSPSPERRDLGFPFVFQDIPAKRRNYLSQRTRLEQHYFPDSARRDQTTAVHASARQTQSLPDNYHPASQPQLSAPESSHHVSPSHHHSPVRHLSQGAEPTVPHVPILKINHSLGGYVHHSPERAGGNQARHAHHPYPNPEMSPDRLRRERESQRLVQLQSEQAQLYQLHQASSPERQRKATSSHISGGADLPDHLLPKSANPIQVERSRWDRWSAERTQSISNPRQNLLEPNRNMNLLDPASGGPEHTRVASWSGDQSHDQSKGFLRNARSHSPERNRGREGVKTNPQNSYGVNLDVIAAEAHRNKVAHTKRTEVNLSHATAITGPMSPKRSNLTSQTQQLSSHASGTGYHHGNPNQPQLRPRTFSDSVERVSAGVRDQNHISSNFPKHSHSFQERGSYGYATRQDTKQADRSPEIRVRHFIPPHDSSFPPTQPPLRRNVSIGAANRDHPTGSAGRLLSGRPDGQQYSRSQEHQRPSQGAADSRTNPHNQHWSHNPLQDPSSRTHRSSMKQSQGNSPKQSQVSAGRHAQGLRVSLRERESSHGNQTRLNPLLRMPTAHAPVSQV